MADLFDRIALILQSEPTSKAVADLLEAVKIETDRIAARREEIKSEALDPLTSPATVKKRRTELVEIEFDAERLTVAVARLETALQQAQGREKQVARQEAYDAAQKAMLEVGEAISMRWDVLAAEMRDLLLAGTRAMMAVADANKNLPDGAEPIGVHPVFSSRVPAVPEQILREETVTLWACERSGNILTEDQLEPGQGRRRVRGTANRYAVQRAFREEEYVPKLDGYSVKPLYEAVEIPAAHSGAPAFWERDRSPIASDSLAGILAKAEAREEQRQKPTARCSHKRHVPLFDIKAERAAMPSGPKEPVGYDPGIGQLA